MRMKVKQEVSVGCVREPTDEVIKGLYFMAVTKYHLRSPALRKRWPVSGDEFEFAVGEPQSTAAHARADAKRKAKMFAKWFPGSKVVANDETGDLFTIQVVDKREQTFAEFGIVSEDYRSETIH